MLELRILSPIAKVFPTDAPATCEPRFSSLRGEVISFQLAYRPLPDSPMADRSFLRLEIESPVKEFIRVRRVKWIPVRQGALMNADP